MPKPRREETGRDHQGGGEQEPAPAEPRKKRANIAPDAVKDPSEKTDGKPSVPPRTGDAGADPGAG